MKPATMLTTKDIRRALATFLALSLAMSSPAFALRDQEVAEKKPEVLAGLEEALRGDPGRLVQMANTTFSLSRTPATTAPAPTPATAVPSIAAAGMEESGKGIAGRLIKWAVGALVVGGGIYGTYQLIRQGQAPPAQIAPEIPAVQEKPIPKREPLARPLQRPKEISTRSLDVYFENLEKLSGKQGGTGKSCISLGSPLQIGSTRLLSKQLKIVVGP